MIRVITGTAKNRKLKIPKDPKFKAVQEIAKGSLFSIIADKVIGATCLDLYAGSGNIGIEALSRGAGWADFVEENRESCRTISENLKNCNLEESAEVVHRDATKFAANTDKKYDLIFCDPYYDDVNHVFLMENLEEILKEDGMIAFFHGENLDIEKIIKNTKLKVLDKRKFGAGLFTILVHG